MFIACPQEEPAKDLGKLLKKHRLIPNVLKCEPQTLIKILYSCDVKVQPSDYLSPDVVRLAPIIRWMSDPHKYYTLAMIEPDGRRDNHDYLHWLVGNIPGCDVVHGDILAAYIGAQPSVDTGRHRYLFVAYKQYCELDFEEPPMTVEQNEGRFNFNINRFAKKYALGNPVAANFFLSEFEYDDFDL
ncbi:protein D2 [Drosophila willistoni]|uniref:protein D2 n=1 Tax=Drosophila willistoni TaxID=7260 RepID=UPI000C26D970|nr:protein D2 [Drosophila willistoni]